MPKHETENAFYWITGEETTVWWWNLVSLYNVTRKKERKIFIKKFYEKWDLETSSRPFSIRKKFLFKKESEEVCLLIGMNIDSVAIAYVI